MEPRALVARRTAETVCVSVRGRSLAIVAAAMNASMSGILYRTLRPICTNLIAPFARILRSVLGQTLKISAASFSVSKALNRKGWSGGVMRAI